MTSLLELRLFRNQLTTLPTEIQELHNLEKLLASSNSLSSLPDVLTSLVGLKIVHLGDNKFKDFPNQLLALTQMRVRIHILTGPPIDPDLSLIVVFVVVYEQIDFSPIGIDEPCQFTNLGRQLQQIDFSAGIGRL